MRWLGVAQRSLEIAARRARRHAFGKPLAEHQAIGWMLADSAIEIHASRLMVLSGLEAVEGQPSPGRDVRLQGIRGGDG